MATKTKSASTSLTRKKLIDLLNEDLAREFARRVVIDEDGRDVEVRYVEQGAALGDGIHPRLAHRITQLGAFDDRGTGHVGGVRDVSGRSEWCLARAGRQ